MNLGAQPKVAPSDTETERKVLGGVMLSEDVDVVAELLSEDDWYSPAHALIWGAMLALRGRSVALDHTTLRAELVDREQLARVGGDEYLFTLTNTLPTAVNIEDHARIVLEKAQRRRMIQACTKAAAAGYDTTTPTVEYLDAAEAEVFAAAQAGDASGGLAHCRAAVIEATKMVEAYARSGSEGVTGLGTGLEKVDQLTTGFHPGELIIIAARPGMGKTALATRMLVHAAKQDPVAMFSLEMPEEQLTMRMICCEGGIDARRVRQGKMGRDDWPKWAECAAMLDGLPLHIDDTPGATLMQVRSRCRRLKAKAGALGLVVIDYLQLMRSGMKRESREIEVGDISRGLKELAKELECPVVALAQLNRECEKRKDKRPMLSDLRESGSVEQDADVVAFIYRDEVYDPGSRDAGVAEVILRKQRSGPCDTARVRWNAEYMRFDDLRDDDHYRGPGEYQD